jgi:hypothetical protein
MTTAIAVQETAQHQFPYQQPRRQGCAVATQTQVQTIGFYPLIS